jgi:2-dehydro-3-deoxygalactonokinase
MLESGLIAVDWGTTGFRAYRLDADGTVRDRVAARRGILGITAGGHADVLREQIGGWLADAAPAVPPVLLCGMIGSRQGWQEAPYVSCPAGAEDLAAALTPVDIGGGQHAWIVPGLAYHPPDGSPDVIRGEETQILGALELRGADVQQQLFCLPGTHSKWALVADGRILRFATFMSGEVFAALAEHTILGRLMEDGPSDPAAFALGLDRAGARGGILHLAFSVRTEGLFGRIPATGLRSYLSGLVIGEELAGALALFGNDSGQAITVIGAPDLAELYGSALRRRGLRARLLHEDAAAHGCFRLARLRLQLGAGGDP